MNEWNRSVDFEVFKRPCMAKAVWGFCFGGEWESAEVCDSKTVLLSTVIWPEIKNPDHLRPGLFTVGLVWHGDARETTMRLELIIVFF